MRVRKDYQFLVHNERYKSNTEGDGSSYYKLITKIMNINQTMENSKNKQSCATKESSQISINY